MNRREVMAIAKATSKSVKQTTVRVTRSTRSNTNGDASSITTSTLTELPTKVTKVKKTKTTKVVKPKRIIYEDTLAHIEVPKDLKLPITFVDHHSEEFIEAIEHILAVDPLLYRPIVAQNFDRFSKEVELASQRLTRDEIVLSHWLSLISSVMSQQISGSAAAAIYARYEKLYKSKPNPAETLTFLTEQLREIGLSGQKVKYVYHISEVFSNPEEKLAQYDFYETASTEELIEELVKLKGIGEWSAKMFMFFTLKQYNVFAHDDLGVARGAAYYLSKRPELVKKIKADVSQNEELKAMLKKKGKFEKPSSKRDWVPFHDLYLIQLSTLYEPYKSVLMMILWRLSNTSVAILDETTR